MHWGWEIRDPVSEIIAARLNSKNFDSLLMSALQRLYDAIFTQFFSSPQICHTFTIFRYILLGQLVDWDRSRPPFHACIARYSGGLTQSPHFLSYAILALCGKSSYLNSTPARIIQTPRNILAISCRFG